MIVDCVCSAIASHIKRSAAIAESRVNEKTVMAERDWS